MKKLVASLMISLFLFVPAFNAAAEEDQVPMFIEESLCESVMETPNPYLKLSQLSAISTTDKAYIKIFSGLSVSDVTRLWNDLIYLKEETDIRDVHMFINSPGGDAFSGLALADLISQAQEEWGFTITAHASGIIASAAVPVFAVCEIRNAQPGTIFMVHEAALWKWPGRETHSDIISQGRLMTILQKQYLSYLVKNSNLTYKEWKAKEGNTTWFSVEEAQEWGLLERGEE